uniref:HECT-type E3 ubiquitin transferase n=1 Tax=Heterorhabditis bacteriophora TaxID=37862 RepID=A0A1I7XR63_HETBA
MKCCTRMELAGRVLGLALLHRCLIDTFFTRTFYKMLLEQPITIHDLEHVDNEFYRSMIWIRENPIDLSLGMSFLVTQDDNGVLFEKELLPNGADLPVTDLNKEEFISLVVKWRVERGVEQQTKALLRGIHQIIDRDFLRVFTVDQLELVLSGSIEINLDDWRSNTEYRISTLDLIVFLNLVAPFEKVALTSYGGYYDEHVLIEWFWTTVEDMTNGNRLKLLQFVTGTSSVPFEGFAMLRGSNGPKRFTIEKWGDEGSLPRAHTCFNRLDLPCYPTRHILKAKLFMAITEGINYAIE